MGHYGGWCCKPELALGNASATQRGQNILDQSKALHQAPLETTHEMGQDGHQGVLYKFMSFNMQDRANRQKRVIVCKSISKESWLLYAHMSALRMGGGKYLVGEI